MPAPLFALLLMACSSGGNGRSFVGLQRTTPPTSAPLVEASSTATVPVDEQTPVLAQGTPLPGASPGAASPSAASTPPSTPSPTPAHSTPSPTPAPPPATAALYRALLASPFPPDELPPGFSGPSVGAADFFINDLARAHGVLGEVDVTLSGPDASDAIVYLVFPDADAARAVFDGQAPAAPYTNSSSVDVPAAGFPLRCNSFGGRGPNGQLAGVTLCNALLGEVEVIGFSQALFDEGAPISGGNMDAALALTRAGAAHLNAVRGTQQ